MPYYVALGNNIIWRHDDVITWKLFPRYWPFVRGIHRSPVNSPHKGHWRGALMFSLLCAWINGWVYNVEAGKLRRHCAHYDVIVMVKMMIRGGVTSIYQKWYAKNRHQELVLSPRDIVSSNHLSLPLIAASCTTLSICIIASSSNEWIHLV